MFVGELGGVPFLRAEGPGPLRAWLMFGVGRRDEQFITAGITHLVEHLAMSTAARPRLDCDGWVDAATTAFHVSGDPLAVGRFLSDVTSAIADLPLDRLAIEASVLSVEDGQFVSPVVGDLLDLRYGCQGLGLLGYPEPAVEQVTSDEVVQWARRFFHRQNVVLAAVGELGAVELRLPQGESVTHETQSVTRLPLPVWLPQIPADVDRFGWSMEVPNTSVSVAVARLLHDRLHHEVRHQRGLSYEIDFVAHALDNGKAHLALELDTRTGSGAEVATLTREVVLRLADEGPTVDEISADVRHGEQHLSDVRSVDDELLAAARDLVLNRPHVPTRLCIEEVRTSSGSEWREILTEGIASAICLIGEDQELAWEGWTSPTWQDHESVGRRFPRRWRSEAPRGAFLMVGDDAVSLNLPNGRRITIAYADVVGLAEHADGSRGLLDIQGREIEIDPNEWRDGPTATALISQRIPSRLHYDAVD